MREACAYCASNGQEVLVYGVVVNHYEPFEGSIGGVFSNRRGPVSGNTSLEQATNDLVNQIRETNPHLSVVPNSTRRQTIDQGRALSVVLGGRSPVTGPLPWPVFENLDDGGSNIVFSIEPRQRDIWVERSFPDEASVALKLHASVCSLKF